METLSSIPCTAEAIKLNWGLISADEKAQLEADGIISTVVEFNSNLSGVGAKYRGRLEIRRVVLFVATGAEIAVVHDWVVKDQADFGAALIYQVLGFAAMQSPVIQGMLLETNNGQMPAILEPEVEPEPEIVEPEPQPEEPGDEENGPEGN